MQGSNCNLSRGEIKKKKEEEKFPWIRAWLQDVIISIVKLKNGRLNSERRRLTFLFLRLLPLETKENHLQKKGNAAKIVSAQPGENIDRLVLPRFSNQSGLPQPTTRRWISDLNPSPTVQPWQDCWCPSPSKRLTPQQDLSSSQEGRDVLKNHLLFGPIKGQRRASRKGRGEKRTDGKRIRKKKKKQRGWHRERTIDRRRGGSSQRRHPLSRQPPSSSASLPATARPGMLVPSCIFNYNVPVTPAGKQRERERERERER